MRNISGRSGDSTLRKMAQASRYQYQYGYNLAVRNDTPEVISFTDGSQSGTINPGDKKIFPSGFQNINMQRVVPGAGTYTYILNVGNLKSIPTGIRWNNQDNRYFLEITELDKGSFSGMTFVPVSGSSTSGTKGQTTTSPPAAAPAPTAATATAQYSPIEHPVDTKLYDPPNKSNIIVLSPFSFRYENGEEIVSTNNLHDLNDWNDMVIYINKLSPATEDTITSPQELDENKAKAALTKIFNAVLNKSLKIDIAGVDFRAESKVWRGVINGLGGAEPAADDVLKVAGLSDSEKLDIQKSDVNKVDTTISRKTFLSKIHNYLYGLKKQYVKSFAGMTVASEEQIAEAVKNKGQKVKNKKAKGASLEDLHLISKVAGRRERARKNLEDVIEKEASDSQAKPEWVKKGLVVIFEAILKGELKVDSVGFDLNSESKVWKNMINELGGTEAAAEKVLTEAGMNNTEKLEVQYLASFSRLKSIESPSYPFDKKFFSRINDYFYKLKKENKIKIKY